MTEERPTRIVIVRHAEPQSHVDRIVSGAAGDTGLSPLGRKQAEALAERLRRTGELAGADRLIASTLPRAAETAAIVAPALGLDPEADERFIEWHPGEADGLSWEDFEERYPVPESGWDPFLNRAPGDESWAEFQLRAQRNLFRLVEERHGQTTVVVCHGGIIVASMYAFFGFGFSGGSVWLEPEYASVTEWLLRPDEPQSWRRNRWVLVRYSDAAHVHETGFATPRTS